MGKKSRLKRQRRAPAPDLLQFLEASHRRMNTETEKSLQGSGKSLVELFAQYSADAVVLALSVSDLWLPNISSQVKHHFALGVALSMSPNLFSAAKKLDTYADFVEFVGACYKLLPSFPSLEDFVPEPDWGEVRIPLNDIYPMIFYGGSVERIPDFIQAFRMLRADQSDAMQDMAIAIALQDQVIAHVRSEIVGSAQKISPGHIGIPSESYWSECREALLCACDTVQAHVGAPSDNLILELGNLKRPATWNLFGDAVMQGTSLPALQARVNGKLLPVSLRNVTSVVIDFWAERDKEPRLDESARLNSRVGGFLLRRFGQDAVVSGPMRLASRTGGLAKRFAAVFKTDKKIYLIAMMTPGELSTLGELELLVQQLMTTSEEWALVLEGHGQALQFKRHDGSQPGLPDIEILAVLTHVATSWMHLELPKTVERSRRVRQVLGLR
jgi:hypothetical protein